jgi:hypothetical protein
MGRTLDQVIASLPARQERIETRFNDLKEVERLRELRLAAGKAQPDVATALKPDWKRPPS